MKLILGNGKTAQSIARFLNKKDISFTLIEDSREIKDTHILQKVDEIFVSPGIAQTQDIIVSARAKNTPVVSDIELFGRYAKAPIIGITGSNGKSTVTQLLGEMIANDGKKVVVGGNIGTPALDCLQDEVEFYVLELSSYQLDYTQHLNLLTGTVLNITPDHLDRYPSFADYVDSKLSLQKYCQHLVINLDEPHTPKQNNAKYFGMNLPKNPDDFGTVTCHGSIYLLKGDDTLMGVDDMPLIGQHNIANVLAALTLGSQIGLSTDAIIDTIKYFKGLEHRLEWVVKKDNIDYYNDSKATNSISTITAIQALISKYQNICLIIGGIQKHEDYAQLFALIDTQISNVVLIGKSTDAMAKDIHKANVIYADSMQAAVESAKQTSPEVVLLSPACASFDMFDDFEQRGQAFKDYVLKNRQ